MAGVVADRVIVELEAKLGRYEANVRAAEARFDKATRNIERSAQRAEKVVGGSFRGLGRLLLASVGTAGLIAGARGFIAYVDAAKQLSASLKLATANTGDFATAQKDVRRIAAETRSDLNSTGQLYANIARNARDLGLTQADVARVTKTVAESFLISGSSAVEAAQGTRQLIQGLQSGVLRGDEFNTVMESAPRLARLLAESLGVPIGQLRAMAEAGELTAATLTKALSDPKFTAQLDSEFKQLPVTFDQAMTLVSNAAQETFSAFDAGGQFSTSLANFLTQGSEGFSDLATDAEQLGIDIASAMAGLSSAFDPMLDAAMSAFDRINGEALGLRDSIASLLGSLDQVGDYVNRVRGNAGSLGNLLGGPGSGSGRYVETYGRSDMRGRFLQGYDARSRSLQRDAQERAVQRLPGTGNSFQRYLNEPNKYNPFGVELNPPGARVIPGKTNKPKGRKGPSAEQLAAKAERERLQQEREDEAFRQELSHSNEDILAARQALSTAAEAVAAYEVEQINIARDRTNAGYESDVVQKRLTRVQADQLIEANNTLAALKVEGVNVRERERVRAEAAEVAQADLKNQIDLADNAAQLAETRTEQRAVALRILDAQYELERLELENVIASRDATDAQKEIARRRLAILGQLQAGDRAAIERQHESPGAGYLRGLNAQDINDQLEQVQVDGLKGLEDQLTSTIGKVFELGGAFGQIANQIISDLIRIAVQKAIIGPLANALFGGGSGLGGIVGGLFGGGATGGGMSSGIVGPRASGGHVRAGQIYKVNENGIEGFQPSQSGQIIPLGRMNGAGGGGTSIFQSFTLDARYGITTPELLRHVNQVAAGRAAQAGRAAFDASQKSLPARFTKLQKLGS